MRTARWVCTAIAVTMAILPATTLAQNIDTRDVDTYVWGGGGIYGQSFTVGTSTTLTSFSFWVGANDPQIAGGTGPYQFYTQLFAWNGSTVTGSALYTSGVLDAVCCDSNVPPRFDFSVGSLALTSGAQYLALVANTAEGVGLKLGYATTSSGFGSTYAGGEFIGGSTPAGGPPDATTASYYPIAFAPGNDLMFAADFARVTATPEPATFGLMITGLIGIGFVRRRRQG